MRMRRGHRTIVVAVTTITCWMCVQVASADTLRVDSTSTAMIPDGSSWALSFPFLQDALSAAQPGDVIIVAQGMYFPDDGVGFTQGERTHSFELKDQVVLLGGFAGLQGQNPDDRDTTAFLTILSGDLLGNDTGGMTDPSRNDNSLSVVNGGQGTDSQAQLDGFTIRDGQGGTNGSSGSGSGGGGMIVDSFSSPTIRTCTFTRNFGGSGGGLLLDDLNKPVIEDCLFIDNEASEGGGMTIRNLSDPQVVNCRFEMNVATNAGGGGVLMKLQPKGTFTDCIFVENTHTGINNGGGGLLICNDGDATLRGCLFDTNVAGAARRGGGAYTDLSSRLTVVDCTFINNESGSVASGSVGQGGAVYLQTNNSNLLGGTITSRFINCTFQDNNAVSVSGTESRGGAVMLPFFLVNSEWTNCLFSGNTADAGGVMYSQSAGPTIVNCTFTENAAAGNGGGIWMSTTFPLPVLTNCIFWANSDPGGSDESAQVFVSSGSAPTVTYSCIQDNDQNDANIPFGGAANGNIDDDPMFRNPTEGDFRLQGCSPSIDAADSSPTTLPDAEDVDQDTDIMELTPDLDKRMRDVDEAAIPDTGNGSPDYVDIGAFEFQLAGDVTIDAIVDGEDIQEFVDCLLIGNPAVGACISADMDFDGSLTINDVPCFIAALLGEPCAPCGQGAQRGGAGNTDCNANGIPDATDILLGTSQDCNANFIPDECDIDPTDPDGDGLTSNDLNANGIPDECEPDCNGNGVPDDKDIADATSTDLNANGIPDECDDDCNSNGIPDELDIDPADPDGNGQVSPDCNGNGFPDECDPDCNGNGVPDDCDVDPTDPDGDGQVSPDCNGNGWPDACDMTLLPPFGSLDCNNNGIPDECDIASGTSEDCNANGFPDECDIATGISEDANTNGIPDECEAQQSQGGGGSSPSSAGATSETESTGTGTSSALSESETEQVYAEFYEWCYAQQWGPGATRTGSQQFQAMVDKMRELGLSPQRP